MAIEKLVCGFCGTSLRGGFKTCPNCGAFWNGPSISKTFRVVASNTFGWFMFIGIFGFIITLVVGENVDSSSRTFWMKTTGIGFVALWVVVCYWYIKNGIVGRWVR